MTRLTELRQTYLIKLSFRLQLRFQFGYNENKVQRE